MIEAAFSRILGPEVAENCLFLAPVEHILEWLEAGRRHCFFIENAIFTDWTLNLFEFQIIM